jgi:hypothetical protein
MTERYFDKFQRIEYANTVALNITQRTAFLPSVYNNPLFYYPYDVKQGERPDMIADRYYGDDYLAWNLYLANQVIDPYYDWYMDQSTFDLFVEKKYGSYENAVSKIKFYRNNWYSDPTPTISTEQYSVLHPNLFKFYEPVQVPGSVTASPRQYTRRKIDWILNTNALSNYTVINGTEFILDEIVDIRFNTNQIGRGQVVYRDQTSVKLQQLEGVVTTGTIGPNSVLIGRESNHSTQFTACSLLVESISAGEVDFWSPVTYYEYEQDINERNKSILVLKAEYNNEVTNKLKRLLRDG